MEYKDAKTGNGINAEQYNTIQKEIVSIIEMSGLKPSKTSDQAAKAIEMLVEKNIAKFFDEKIKINFTSLISQTNNKIKNNSILNAKNMDTLKRDLDRCVSDINNIIKNNLADNTKNMDIITRDIDICISQINNKIKNNSATSSKNIDTLAKDLDINISRVLTKIERNRSDLKRDINSSVNEINKKIKSNYTLVDTQIHPIVHLKHKVGEMEAKLDSIIRQLNPPVQPDTRSWDRYDD